MGRIRTIKPEFHAHEDLSKLPPETHLLAAALLNYADDEGYFNAHPVLVKAGTNPLRNDPTPMDIQLHQLCKIGYIEIAQHGDKCFGRIVAFTRHQRVSHALTSKLKEKFEALPKLSRDNLELFGPELKGNREVEQGRGTAPPNPERSDSGMPRPNPEVTMLVDRIIVTHPRSAARNLSFSEVTRKQRVAVLTAMHEEMERAGVSGMEALDMIFARVEAHARDVPPDQHPFFKDVEGYFKNYDYRIPSEHFKGKENRNGNNKGKTGHTIDAAARVIQAFEDRAAAERVRGQETGETGGPGLHGLRVGTGTVRTERHRSGSEENVIEATRRV
jgi:hypothetical protein